jgi:hypothetical protein
MSHAYYLAYNHTRAQLLFTSAHAKRIFLKWRASHNSNGTKLLIQISKSTTQALPTIYCQPKVVLLARIYPKIPAAEINFKSL